MKAFLLITVFMAATTAHAAADCESQAAKLSEHGVATDMLNEMAKDADGKDISIDAPIVLIDYRVDVKDPRFFVVDLKSATATGYHVSNGKPAPELKSVHKADGHKNPSHGPRTGLFKIGAAQDLTTGESVLPLKGTGIFNKSVDKVSDKLGGELSNLQGCGVNSTAAEYCIEPGPYGKLKEKLSGGALFAYNPPLGNKLNKKVKGLVGIDVSKPSKKLCEMLGFEVKQEPKKQFKSVIKSQHAQ